MWVLEPIAVAPATQQPQQPPAPLLLVGSEVSVGRPLKKGSTVGKANVLIFNEQSVSSIHAKLQIQPASSSNEAEGGFQHGAISITDVSRYGTHLTRSGQQEQKLASNEAVQLQDKDVLRFGSNSRYQLVQRPVALVASSSCQDAHPELQQQAARLNMQLCTSAPDTDAAGTTPAAAAQQMYYAATTGETVTPTLLKGLVAGQPVVTPAWAQAAAAKVVWSGQLPPPQDYTPERLLLPCAEADASSSQDQEGQQELVLASWHAPSAGLLSSYSLAFEVGCQEDLIALAAACGAQHVTLTKQPRQAKLAAQQEEAAAAGKAAVLILHSDWSAAALQQPPKHHRATAAAKHLPSVSELQLLLAIAHNTTGVLEAASQLYAEEHGIELQPLQHTQQQQPQGDAPAAAGGGGGDDGDVTEADETEEAADADEEMADGPPAAAAAAGTAATEAAAAGQAHTDGQRPAAAPQGGKAGSLLLPPTPVSQRVDMGEGWHTHPSSSMGGHATQGRTTGSKRTAAAAAAPSTSDAAAAAAAAAPSSKRRKTGGAAGSPTKSPLPLQRKSRHQQPAQSADTDPVAAAPAGGFSGGGGGGPADSAAEQGQQGEGDDVGRSTEAFVQLCIPVDQQQQQHLNAAAGDDEAQQQVPNFKAFRRRGAGQQQQEEGAPLAPVIQLVEVKLQQDKGPDVDAFLRDEKLRQDRVRKADELFNANIKAVKKAPAAAGAGRGRKK